MKQKQTYLILGTSALLFFVIIGYVVSFYPDQLSVLDVDFQAWLRGDFAEPYRSFFTHITVLGNSPVIIAYTALLAAFFYYGKHWRSEGLMVIGNLLVLGLLSTVLKFAYNRPRPSLEYLIEKPIGASFPSWHAAASLMVAVSLAIIIQQRMTSLVLKRSLQLGLIVLAVLVGLSRVYIGVHYPTDILAGWLLTVAIASLTFPYYATKRFQWRFASKQK